MAEARTLSEKIWDQHLVHRADGEPDLLYIDLHLVHEVTSPQAFDGLRLAGRTVRRPDLTVATEDHNVPTADIDQPIADPISRKQVEVLRANTGEFGILEHPMGTPGQGIVHIIGPEQGLTMPGMTIVCGDSHTATHGAFGALAFGIGTSEVEHVLATQTLPQHVPGTMAVDVEGELPAGVTAKDLILAIIGRIGTGGGIGSIIEYRGSAIRGLSMEGRMTVCNMSIEAGAKAGLIAPDDTTFAYLEGRQYAPEGQATGRRRSTTGARCPPTTAPPSTRASPSTPPRCDRSSPGAPTPARSSSSTPPCPTPTASPTRASATPPAGRSSTWASPPARRCERSPSRRCSSARAPTAASRTCAPPPSVAEGHRSRPGVRAMVVPGSFAVKRPGRGGGPRPHPHRRRLRLARARAARCAWP